MDKLESLINEQAQLQIDTGIKPLELKFIPIRDLEEGQPFAFRTKTIINSTVEGVLQEKDYTFVSDNKDICVELLKHNLGHAVYAIEAFKTNRKNIDFVTVRCPSNILQIADIYEVLKDVVYQYPDFDMRKICLEFPSDILDTDIDKASTGLKDIKLLKFKSAIVGAGNKDFKLSKLAYITPDFVFVDKEATSWADNRNKPYMLSRLVSYLASIGVQVINEGEQKHFRALQRTDSIGFISVPNEVYSLEEAIKLGKEVGDDGEII